MIADPAALLDEAARRADLEGWPHDDTAFLAALEVFLGSCRQTARLNDMGTDVLHKVVVRHLQNRLLVRGYVEAHPDAARRELANAVVITGLPRTGTTLLHNLMALDPTHCVLRVWQALHPVPPADATGRDHLVEGAARWLERFYAIVPKFRTIHPLTPDGPEECDALLQNSFVSQHFEDMFDAPAYSNWLASADLTHAYSHYALQLRVLTPDDHQRWVLKSPGHLGHLPELTKILPGCVVVWCHRRPLDAVASHASLVSTLRRAYASHVEPSDVGAQCLQRAAVTVRRATAARTAIGGHAFVDVDFDELASDPIAAVERIYAHLDRHLSPETRAAMEVWLARNPRHRDGRHRYNPEQFGLSPSVVASTFGEYGAAPHVPTPTRHSPTGAPHRD